MMGSPAFGLSIQGLHGASPKDCRGDLSISVTQVHSTSEWMIRQAAAHLRRCDIQDGAIGAGGMAQHRRPAAIAPMKLASYQSRTSLVHVTETRISKSTKISKPLATRFERLQWRGERRRWVCSRFSQVIFKNSEQSPGEGNVNIDRSMSSPLTRSSILPALRASTAPDQVRRDRLEEEAVVAYFDRAYRNGSDC